MTRGAGQPSWWRAFAGAVTPTSAAASSPSWICRTSWTRTLRWSCTARSRSSPPHSSSAICRAAAAPTMPVSPWQRLMREAQARARRARCTSPCIVRRARRSSGRATHGAGARVADPQALMRRAGPAPSATLAAGHRSAARATGAAARRSTCCPTWCGTRRKSGAPAGATAMHRDGWS